MAIVPPRLDRHLRQPVKQATQILEGDKGSAPDFPGGKPAVTDERIELGPSNAEGSACFGTSQRLIHILVLEN
jgi:hypothetical protein